MSIASHGLGVLRCVTMLANVLYRGLAVAMGTRICRDDHGPNPFVELDPPMPVGTALAIELVRDSGVESRQVKVRRVHEGAPAGMFVAFTDGVAVPKDLPSKQEAALQLHADASAPIAEPVAAKAEPAKAEAAKTEPAKAEPAKPASKDAAPEAEANPEETRRTRRTMQVSIETAEIIRETELGAMQAAHDARNTEEMPAYVEPRDTQEMPAMVTMDAEPEDEVEAPKPTDKPDDNKKGGGRRNRKRSKTVIGH